MKEDREARAKKEAKEKDGEAEKGHRAKIDKETIQRGWDIVQQRRLARKGGDE